LVSTLKTDELEPFAFAEGFEPRQAYQFVVFGEKASLGDIIEPVAREKQADAYVNTGEISDTRLYEIARDAAKDGRPLVVFTMTDCDPSGYQMAISIARKMQAFRDLYFPHLQFEIVPVELLIEQVRELGLPSTPLKETEKRADRWKSAFGVEQTEIDALAALQPDLLREILERAFDPYWDSTLEDRVAQAKEEWDEQAAEAIREQIDQEKLDALREEAGEKFAELQDAIDSLNERLRLETGDHFTLPEIEVPQPEVDEDSERQALVSFDDDWVAATRALIRRKAYEDTVSTLRAARRRLARRVERIEQAEAVLGEMRAGAALHRQHTRNGAYWWLSSGREISDSIAKLVTASSSVVGVGDALFDGVASQQTYRWWKEPVP
jgi:hypothetical protein